MLEGELDAFKTLHHCKLNKEDFCEIWGCAFKEAFTEENIKLAFEATGIHPFNANIISEQQAKLAGVSST
jgi:hypothetical protein